MESEYDNESSESDYDDIDTQLEESNGKLSFDLFEIFSAKPTASQGSLKTFHAKQDQYALFAEDASDYSVSVEKLLWVDGFETLSSGGSLGREMTLVVLKMVFLSSDSNTKIRSVKATLDVKDIKKKGKNHPVVEAWAPFNANPRWNMSDAHHEVTTSSSASLNAAYGGAGISIEGSRERRVSFSQTNFDTAHSKALINRYSNNKNGVQWYLKQNDFQNQGVTPEIWTTILFSRRSKAPYRVSFKLEIHAGTLHDMMNNAKSFFGTKPGQTDTFIVNPGKAPSYNFEGEEIFKRIDVNNLGALREANSSTNLHIEWGPQSRLQPSSGLAQTLQYDKKSARESATTTEQEGMVAHLSEAEARGTPKSDAAANHEKNVHLRNPAMEPSQLQRITENKHTQLNMAGYTAPTDKILSGQFDLVRLVNLESRVAQTEARIAAQDLAMLHLRQELLEKGEKIAKMEQIISLLPETSTHSI